ncbi:hypothetical protein, partial [Streptomyces sp. NPDC050804]|uniref:hypothetical protein n=1 Tax=Streptomyces sp. NPDC050804 TaxID=3154745 RepID=UPI00342A9552
MADLVESGEFGPEQFGGERVGLVHDELGVTRAAEGVAYPPAVGGACRRQSRRGLFPAPVTGVVRPPDVVRGRDARGGFPQERRAPAAGSAAGAGALGMARVVRQHVLEADGRTRPGKFDDLAGPSRQKDPHVLVRQVEDAQELGDHIRDVVGDDGVHSGCPSRISDSRGPPKSQELRSRRARRRISQEPA